MRPLAILGLLILAGCAVVLPPPAGQYDRVTLSYEHTGVPTVTKETSLCRYERPVREAVPALPVFTRKDNRDSDALAAKLGSYVDKLRAYIQRQQRADEEAYNRYVQTCLSGK